MCVHACNSVSVHTVISRNSLCLCFCFFSASAIWYMSDVLNMLMSARGYTYICSVCRSLAVCDVLGGDRARLFARLPQLLCLEVDLRT